METDQPNKIDATFRNGSLTAVSVIVGFSLGFLSRWAGVPGQWHRFDFIAVAIIVVGIGCQINALRELLQISSLMLINYNRSIRVFMVGVAFVAAGIALALVGEMTGLGQHVLGA
ncbi:hypothetical protein [Methylobacterium nigriterrae]|uniref:hypothetical protein n=1 Tax=Methylobacterium nigriterrae TaxID=3127512 RepID=UPI0030137A0A